MIDHLNDIGADIFAGDGQPQIGMVIVRQAGHIAARFQLRLVQMSRLVAREHIVIILHHDAAGKAVVAVGDGFLRARKGADDDEGRSAAEDLAVLGAEIRLDISLHAVVHQALFGVQVGFKGHSGIKMGLDRRQLVFILRQNMAGDAAAEITRIPSQIVRIAVDINIFHIGAALKRVCADACHILRDRDFLELILILERVIADGSQRVGQIEIIGLEHKRIVLGQIERVVADIGNTVLERDLGAEQRFHGIGNIPRSCG